MKVNAILKIMILAVSLVSCKKDKDEAPRCELSATGLSGTYKLTGLTYKASASATEENYLFLMEECEQDDLIKLNSNGTYNYTDAGISCSPGSTDDGTWSVTGNQLQSDGIITGTISSYDCEVLVYYVEDTFMDGDRLTFKMTKQ